MKRRLIILIFTLCLVTALPMVAVAQAIPLLTWGTVTLDGTAAPVGTTVDVYIGADTTPSGSFTVTTAGQYGSIQVWAHESRIGEVMTYRVNGVTATKLGPDPGIFGLANQHVNLEASGSLSTIWSFCAPGFFPKHMPDSYTNEVVLGDLNPTSIPPEVQGVYWYDCATLTWKFWAPGVPGCTLPTLGAGHTYDYMVAVTGPCEWEIPLSIVVPTPTTTPTPVPTPTPLPTISMSCIEARDTIQDALNGYDTQYQEWPTIDGQPGDIEWTKIVPEFMTGIPSNDSLCDWWVNSNPEGEVCLQNMC